jgi:hypothetical protein
MSYNSFMSERDYPPAKSFLQAVQGENPLLMANQVSGKSTYIRKEETVDESYERNFRIGTSVVLLACATSFAGLSFYGWESFRNGRKYVGEQIEPQNGIFAITFKRCDSLGFASYEREMFFRDVLGDPRLHSTLVVHTGKDPLCK